MVGLGGDGVAVKSTAAVPVEVAAVLASKYASLSIIAINWSKSVVAIKNNRSLLRLDFSIACKINDRILSPLKGCPMRRKFDIRSVISFLKVSTFLNSKSLARFSKISYLFASRFVARARIAVMTSFADL